MDDDGGGSVSVEEFQRHWQTDDVKLILSQLGLDVVDVQKFFAVLDCDGDSKLQVEEFVMVCMRYKAQGRTVDIESAVMLTNHLLKKTLALQEEVLLRIDRLDATHARERSQSSLGGVPSDPGLNLEEDTVGANFFQEASSSDF